MGRHNEGTTSYRRKVDGLALEAMLNSEERRGRRTTDNPALIVLLILGKVLGGSGLAIAGVIALFALIILLVLWSASVSLVLMPVYLLLL